MPVTVVVGGQFGSEGKGKVAHRFAADQKASIAVRVGGANSGHTVIDSAGRPRIFRHLPTAALLPDTLCVIAAGSYIDPDVLLSEIGEIGLEPDRVLIDRNAYVITERERNEERLHRLGQRIGSTLSGTGAAVTRRIARDRTATLAHSDERLSRYVANARDLLRERLNRGQRIIIEGTQGFGLSLLHSKHYPFVTSRDTTASGFVSEAGLSPLDVDEVVLVIRAFPIRVAGESGPLPTEIDWKTVSQESGYLEPIVEHSSVTRTVRRVARFDPSIVRESIDVNRPTQIVLNHVDYVDATCRNSPSLSLAAIRFVRRIENDIGQAINFVGTSPSSLVELTNQNSQNSPSTVARS